SAGRPNEQVMKGGLRELLSSEQCLWRAYALHRGSAFGQPSDFSRSKRLRYLFRLRHVKTVLLVVLVDKRTPRPNELVGLQQELPLLTLRLHALSKLTLHGYLSPQSWIRQRFPIEMLDRVLPIGRMRALAVPRSPCDPGRCKLHRLVRAAGFLPTRRSHAD